MTKGSPILLAKPPLNQNAVTFPSGHLRRAEAARQESEGDAQSSQLLDVPLCGLAPAAPGSHPNTHSEAR